MKNYIYLLALLLLFSCGQNQSEKSEKDNASAEQTKSDNSSSANVISFKVDGEQINSEGWIVQRFVWDDKTAAPLMNITSNMHKDKRSINVNLNGDKPGKYNFSENANIMNDSHGTYFPDFSKPLDSYLFTSGEFNITEVDTVKNIVNGTFNGTVKDANGKTFSITDGKLVNVKLRPGLTNMSKEMEKIGK